MIDSGAAMFTLYWSLRLEKSPGTLAESILVSSRVFVKSNHLSMTRNGDGDNIVLLYGWGMNATVFDPMCLFQRA